MADGGFGADGPSGYDAAGMDGASYRSSGGAVPGAAVHRPGPAADGSEVPWTIKRLLTWTAGFFERRGVDAPRLSAEMLLAHVLGVPRIRLYMDYERVVGPAELAAYRELVRRAAEQEPIAYLTGRAPFFSLELEVNPSVLIPRPETETLVEHAVELCRLGRVATPPRVLDLGTGSGAIALAVASRLKSATVVASDVSPQAVAVAKRNAERLGLSDRVVFLIGDLFDALEGTPEVRPFDLVLSNPPYIPTGDLAGLDRSVRDYEPGLALDGGADGMAFHRRILQACELRLTAGGWVLLEMQYDQGPALRSLAGAMPFLTDVRVVKDNAGHDRVLMARRQG